MRPARSQPERTREEDRRSKFYELPDNLAPGGTLVMQHPIDGERPETFEDWTLTAPEARERVFFQRDHLRTYGADFVDRLSQAGIHGIVTTKHQRALADEDVRRFRLTQEPTQIPERDIEADVIYAARREGDA